LLLSAVRAKYIDRQRRAPGSSSAAARGRSTALSSKCGQCHVDSRINKAELGLLSILGHIKVLAVFTACVEFVSGWQHARNYIYRRIERTGLGWIDGQKSPVFRRGKSGNPMHTRRLQLSDGKRKNSLHTHHDHYRCDVLKAQSK